MHVCDHKTHNGHAESRKNNSIDTQKAISVDQTQKTPGTSIYLENKPDLLL